MKISFTSCNVFLDVVIFQKKKKFVTKKISGLKSSYMNIFVLTAIVWAISEKNVKLPSCLLNCAHILLFDYTHSKTILFIL